MQRARVDFELTRGDDFQRTFVFKDNQTPPQPLNYVGITFTAQLRRTYDDSDATSFDIDDSNLVYGTLVLSLPRALTESLGGTYVWDLDMVDGVDALTTPIYGSVYVNLDVTRPVGP